MKISIEIKNDKMVYEYELGGSRQQGKMHASAEHHIFAVEFIKSFMNNQSQIIGTAMAEIHAREYIFNNPEKAIKQAEERLGEIRKEI